MIMTYDLAMTAMQYYKVLGYNWQEIVKSSYHCYTVSYYIG